MRSSSWSQSDWCRSSMSVSWDQRQISISRTWIQHWHHRSSMCFSRSLVRLSLRLWGSKTVESPYAMAMSSTSESRVLQMQLLNVMVRSWRKTFFTLSSSSRKRTGRISRSRPTSTSRTCQMVKSRRLRSRCVKSLGSLEKSLLLL